MEFQILRTQRDGIEAKKEERNDLLVWKACETASVGQLQWRRAD